jgi:hypothetical protein
VATNIVSGALAFTIPDCRSRLLTVATWDKNDGACPAAANSTAPPDGTTTADTITAVTTTPADTVLRVRTEPYP